MNFYEHYKNICKSKGYSPTGVASLAGISRATVSDWKNKGTLPSASSIAKLSKFLGVTTDYLLGQTDTDQQKSVERDTSTAPITGVKVQEVAITGMVAVFGRIPAGFPAFAVENIEGWVPTTLKHPEEHFCLIVHGTSMTGAGIVDGCKVILHRQSTAENGQIVACRVNGDEATLKRFKQIGDVIMLMPENSEFDPIPLTSDDFKTGKAEILGVLKQVIIDY